MVSAISNTTQSEPVARSTEASTQKPARSRPQAAAGTDSVQLSAAAQAALDALLEATETSAQTAKEAGQGDLQAQRLLARESATNSVAR
jgi:hypothetical protein